MIVVRLVVYFSMLFVLVAQEQIEAPSEPQAPLIAPPAPVEIPSIPVLPVPAAQVLDPHAVNAAFTKPKDVNITFKNFTLNPSNPKQIHLTGPIHLVTERGQEVFSNKADLDTENNVYHLTENVRVFSGTILQRGESAYYYKKTDTLEVENMSVSMDPILLEAGHFQSKKIDGNHTIYEGTDAGVTTHDVSHPNYWLRAKETTIYPEEKIVFKDLNFMVGDKTVFWLPYLSQPLNAELGYHFLPGARSAWGVFLLNTYGIMLGEDDPTTFKDDRWLLSQWHVDLLSQRGTGMGVDLRDTRIKKNRNYGWLKFYGIYDQEPDYTRSGIPRLPVDPERWKAQLQYRIPLAVSDTKAKYELNYDLNILSDNYFLEDFDPDKYHSDPQPDNQINFTRATDHSLFTALARVRVNDFYRTDTRSPEFIFDQTKRSIFQDQLLHEGTTSFGFYGEKMANPIRRLLLNDLLTLPETSGKYAREMLQIGRYEQLLVMAIKSLPAGDPYRKILHEQLLNPHYTRFHTYQEFSKQLELADIFTITPRIGAGYTSYMNTERNDMTSNHSILSTGLEASMKFRNDYTDIHSRDWGLDELRHVIQPYAQWSYLSSNNSGDYDPSIERLTYSTRPEPINPNRYTALDDMQNWNLIRLGIRNQLFTKRDGGTLPWLALDTYVDYYMNDPAELDRKFSNVYNDITWQPLPWLSVTCETQFPISGSNSDFYEFATAINFMPTPNWEFTVSNELLNSHPYLPDSNRINYSTYYRINDDWGAGLRHTWQLDNSILEGQSYTLHRNYDNWIISAGLNLRDNLIQKEYGVMFSFTLKDFPTISLPFQVEQN